MTVVMTVDMTLLALDSHVHQHYFAYVYKSVFSVCTRVSLLHALYFIIVCCTYMYVSFHRPGQMPNLFEIHTPDRIFYVSAPTKDEMQSWIGMLQTLKHHIHIRQSNSGSASASAGGGGASASASGSVSEESASRSPSSSPGALKKGSSRPVSSIRLGLKTVPMKSREAQTLPGYTSPTGNAWPCTCCQNN